MFDKVRMWWRWNGCYMHREFVQGVKNLWKWFPIIWKDRDWDHDFIYTLIAKKLEFQADYIGVRGLHTRADHDAKRMRLVAKLIRLEQDSFYAMEYLDYQVTEEYFTPLSDELHFEWKQAIISETFSKYFAKHPLCRKQAIQYIKDNRKRYTSDHTDNHLVGMVMGNLRQTKCRNLIFKIMNQDLERWWD